MWLAAGFLLVALLVVQWLVVQPFHISSASMQPTLEKGDVVLAWKPSAAEISRGDVVIFDGAGIFTDGSDWHSYFAKRVIAVGGDRVTCCAESGDLTVNGAVLDEPYLFAGDVPSGDAFDAAVPEGRYWLMGDHRSRSADSRSRLGSPGGGMVPQEDMIGPVEWIIWPLSRFGPVP